jgi:hypothetical protein
LGQSNGPVGPIKPVSVENTVEVNVSNTPAVKLPDGVVISNTASSPVPVEVVSIPQQNLLATLPEYRIVGFTTTMTNGSIQNPAGYSGLNAMHRYCQDEVADYARACFSSEAQKPPSLTTIEQRQGWIIPERIALFQVGTGFWEGEFIGTESVTGETRSSSAFEDARNFSCSSYRVDDGVGLLYQEERSIIDGRPCTSVFAIACCAPVAIPVSPLKIPQP